MLGVLTTTGRLLRDHWPALLAWYLAGTLGHYLAIELAGIVGAYSDIGGLLLQPFAPLSRLFAYVAMLLVVRDGLRHLGILAPLPTDEGERRRDFGRALLGGTVPFIAFYTAYSYLTQDFKDIVNRTLARRAEHGLDNIDFLHPENSGDPVKWDFIAGQVLITPLSIGILVGAFVLRWLLGREAAKQRRWLAPLTVYLESLWVVLSAQVLSTLIGLYVTDWVQSRVAMVWLADLRAWAAGTFAPLVWAWDGLIWFIGEAGGVILLPLAWLAVTGSIFGHAVSATAPSLSHPRAKALADRYQTLRSPVRRALGDLSSQVTGRFEPIGKAAVLMWRAGPVLIGGFVLLFALLGLLSRLVEWGMTRVIGPHDYADFWVIYIDALVLIPPLLIEPIRIALVAAGYDATLKQLAPGTPTPPAQATQPTENLMNGGRNLGLRSSSLTETSATNGPFASEGSRNGTSAE